MDNYNRWLLEARSGSIEALGLPIRRLWCLIELRTYGENASSLE